MVLLRMDVGGGDLEQQHFEQAWSALAEAAAGEAGHVRDALWSDPQTKGRYWITTEWADLSDFQRFGQSQAHEEFRREIQTLITSRAVHQVRLVKTAGVARATAGPGAGRRGLRSWI
jgi:heme-degrading monooxygenase HmoA